MESEEFGRRGKGGNRKWAKRRKIKRNRKKPNEKGAQGLGQADGVGKEGKASSAHSLAYRKEGAEERNGRSWKGELEGEMGSHGAKRGEPAHNTGGGDLSI